MAVTKEAIICVHSRSIKDISGSKLAKYSVHIWYLFRILIFFLDAEDNQDTSNLGHGYFKSPHSFHRIISPHVYFIIVDIIHLIIT